MASRVPRLVIILAVLGSVTLGFNQAPAQPGYHMAGAGIIEATNASDGMPACLPVLAVPACNANAVANWQFAQTVVVGSGWLDENSNGAVDDDEMIAGNYDCTGGRSIVSTVGDTTNFRLDWKFACKIESGVGYEFVVGRFQTRTGDDGRLVFYGSFDACNATTEPNAVGATACGGNASTNQQSVCAFGFGPTSMNNQNEINEIAFYGQCDTVV